MKPLLVCSGEPAGIGPDLCLAMADYDLPLVVLGDIELLKARSKLLCSNIHFIAYDRNQKVESRSGYLTVLSCPCPHPVKPGQLNPANAFYVINLLELAANLCHQGEFSALVTAPVHKGNINAAGIPFTGHTEFFANFFEADKVVMMLSCEQMRVALVTNHLPLIKVPSALSVTHIVKVIGKLNDALKFDFDIKCPKIKVAGLNPHAGESGFLGREEIEIISPAIAILLNDGICVEGPFPADTLFIEKNSDAFVAMYHDQGLPVIKFADFNRTVNISLGLPIVRTSVDHGTALDLAGKNKADCGSMLAAIKMAITIAQNRKTYEHKLDSSYR